MWNSIYKHLRTLSGQSIDDYHNGSNTPLSPNTIMNQMYDHQNGSDHHNAMEIDDQQPLPFFENFHELPDEVLLNIFQFLSRRNIILQIERVCKHFNQLAKDEFLWWSLTFNKSTIRNSQIMDPTVRLFEQNPERESFVKYKLNCRDYFMESVLVKKSCEAKSNFMNPSVYVSPKKQQQLAAVTPSSPNSPAFSSGFDFSPVNTPTVDSPTADFSPTSTLKRKLRNAWRPVGLSIGLGGSSSDQESVNTPSLFGHDQNYEKRMKMAQEQSTRMGHYNPHARHRHTITCTTPDESSFVMIGGFKNANHAPVVVQNPPPPQQQQPHPLTLEVEDSDVLHEFNTNRAHFSQIRIRTPSSPMTPNTISNQFSFQPLSPLTPNTNAALFNASVNSHWMNQNGGPMTPTTPLTPLSATSAAARGHVRTNSLSGKPMQFGKHSCVCVDNKKLLLFGGTEGENTVVTNHLYTYDLETKEWTQIEFEPDAVQPSARTNHQAALVIGPNGRREMYIVGGGVGQQMTPTDEVWALDIEDYTWRLVEFNLKPDQKTCPFTPRLGFTLHELNNKLILYGGGYWYQNGPEKKWKEYYRELFIFDVKTSVWTNIDMTDCIDHVPRSGTFPVSCRVGAHLFVVGGGIVWDVSSEINVLDLVTLKWRKLNSEQAYAADSSACIALKDYSENAGAPKTKILLFGGYRYKPLSEYKVFAVRWKDFMTERGQDSLTKLESITTSS